MQVVAPISDFFHENKLNHGFAIKSAIALGTNTVASSHSFMKDSYNADPNTFQNAGYGVGEFFGGVADFGSQLGMASFFALRNGGIQGRVDAAGSFTTAEAIEKMNAVDKASFLKNSRSAVKNEKLGPLGRFISRAPLMGGSGGLAKSGIMRNLGMVRGTLAMAAPVAIGFLASNIAGFAGHILDEAWAVRKSNRDIHYDNRFFDTDRYDASTYQQIGSAMNNYESKLVSLSRIYHSR